MPQGKFLGHVVSKDGIAIDSDRVTTIKDFPFLVNKKGVQSFLGKVNFVTKFILDFASLIRKITLMLKKDKIFKWTKETTKISKNQRSYRFSPHFGKSNFNKIFYNVCVY